MHPLEAGGGKAKDRAASPSDEVPAVVAKRVDPDSVRASFLSSMQSWLPKDSAKFRAVEDAVKKRDGLAVTRVGIIEVRYRGDPTEEREVLAYETEGGKLRVLKKHRPWARENEIEGFDALHALGVQAADMKDLDVGDGYFDRSFTPGVPPNKLPPQIIADRGKLTTILRLLGRNDADALAVGKADCNGNMMVVFDNREEPRYVTQHDLTTAFVRNLKVEDVKFDLSVNIRSMQVRARQGGYSQQEIDALGRSYYEGFLEESVRIMALAASDPGLVRKALGDHPMAAEWEKVLKFFTSHQPKEFLPDDVLK